MILLASSNKELLARWEKGVLGISSVYAVSSPKQFKEKLTKLKPDILLLEYDFWDRNPQKDILGITVLIPHIKIVIFTYGVSEEHEWALFKSGVSGCCHYDMKPEQINYAVRAVLKGELWIRRSLTSHMLEELVEVTLEKDRIEGAIHDLLSNLTKREYEIALLVGSGESNKRIANQLAITERTVKAHLTEIFRKLQISDRIKLALMMKDTISSLKPSFDFLDSKMR